MCVLLSLPIVVNCRVGGSPQEAGHGGNTGGEGQQHIYLHGALSPSLQLLPSLQSPTKAMLPCAVLWLPMPHLLRLDCMLSGAVL